MTTPTCSSGTSMITCSIGSHELVVDALEDDLRARHLELEALAAHRLDQDAEVQLAAAATP